MTTGHLFVTLDNNHLATVTGGKDDARQPAGDFQNPPEMIGQKKYAKSVWRSRKPNDTWDNLIFR